MDDAERLAAASGDFIVALRANDGFREDLYSRLVVALQECTLAWQGADCIPRLAVNVLVDIVSAVQGSAEAYPEPVRQRIYDCSFALVDLIQECVAIEPE